MKQSSSNPRLLSFASKIQRWLYRIEDAVLVGLLTLMILLATIQIFLRNFMDFGLVWGDIMVRILVLWVGLIGAMAASRKGDHIKIDLISKYLTTRSSWIIKAVTDFFTAVVCLIVVLYSIKLIRFEYIDANMAFGNIPVWICQMIIPCSFLVMALRYTVSTISNFLMFFDQKT
ncbi:MAG: TRAP transporter small permease [Desulfobacterales bacterium]